jgi:hypothetical protein
VEAFDEQHIQVFFLQEFGERFECELGCVHLLDQGELSRGEKKAARVVVNINFAKAADEILTWRNRVNS